MDPTGQVLAERYALVRLLGEGGMGQVWEARHVELDKPVAVKLLAQDLAGDAELLERFRREARITASLRHASIVEVMDYGVTPEGQPWIVMEMLSGESLGDLLVREGTVEPDRAREIMLQVLSGLSAAHARGIVHRDLKPDNVFLDEEPGRGQVVKILDFGISKIYGAEEDLQLTRTGVAMGTPYYMSPEQVMGDREMDARSDLYACGVILYEMLTGRRPFDGETHNEVVVRIMSDEVPPVSRVRPEIGEPLSDVIARAMSRDPSDRFESAGRFADVLIDLGAEHVPWSGTHAFPAARAPTGLEREPSSSPSSAAFAPTSAVERPRRGSAPLWIVPLIIGLGLLIVIAATVVGVVACTTCGRKDVDDPSGTMPTTVTITPRGMPDGSTVIWQDQVLPASPFQVPRGEDPVVFSVRARGYEPGEFEVIPDRDRQIRIRLVPLDPEPDDQAVRDPDDRSKKKPVKKKKKKKNPFKKLKNKLKN